MEVWKKVLVERELRGEGVGRRVHSEEEGEEEEEEDEEKPDSA